MERRPPSDVRAGIEDPRTFVRLLVLGEVLTPRGDVGPLARFWVPAGPRRRAPVGRTAGGGRPGR